MLATIIYASAATWYRAEAITKIGGKVEDREAFHEGGAGGGAFEGLAAWLRS